VNIHISVRGSVNNREKEIVVKVEGINSYGDTETDMMWITKDMLLEVLNSGEKQ
jgi:hypothetical protein